MKRLTIFLFGLMLFIGCDSQQATDLQAEVDEVEALLESFFDALATWDYQRLRDLTAEDYILIEDGVVWTIEDLIEAVRPSEGQFSITYTFTDVTTTVEIPNAWTTYKNTGTATFAGQQQQVNWTESAVFRQKEDGWEMVLLHSTVIEPDTTRAVK